MCQRSVAKKHSNHPKINQPSKTGKKKKEKKAMHEAEFKIHRKGIKKQTED